LYAEIKISKEDASTDPRMCALFVAYRITDIYYKPWMLSEVALKFYGTKYADKIPVVLTEAETIAKGLDNPSYRADALLEVARGYAKTGEFNKAEQIAYTIGSLLPRVKTFCLISRHYMEADKKEEAKNILLKGFETTKGDGDKNMDMGLLEIVKALVESGAFGDARAVSEKIVNGAKKTEALCVTAGAYFKIKDISRANEMIAAAEKVAGASDDKIDLSGACVEIAKTYILMGNKERAKKYAEEAFEISEKIESKYSKPELLARISAVYGDLGELDQALIIANSISDKNYGPRALAKLAVFNFNAGKKDEAYSILASARTSAKSIRSAYAQANVMVDIADSYAEMNDFDSQLAVSELMSDDYNKPRSLGKTAVNFAKKGDAGRAQDIFEKALKVTSEIEDNFYKAWALAEISNKYSDAGLAPDRRAYTILRRIANEEK